MAIDRENATSLECVTYNHNTIIPLTAWYYCVAAINFSWPCTTPVAWDLHCTSARTNPALACDALPAHRPCRQDHWRHRRSAKSVMHWMTCLYRRFVFTNDDKREFFRTQRERIHAGRHVDTTDSMRLVQTALRDWPAPHTIPARAPYGHASLLHRRIGGGNDRPDHGDMSGMGTRTYPAGRCPFGVHIAHKGGAGAKPSQHTHAHVRYDLHCSVHRSGISNGG